VIYGFNAHEVFQIAIDIEKNGKRFYEKAMDLVDNPDVKALLSSLAQRDCKEEGRAVAGFRLHPDAATMGFHQPLTYKEPQPSPSNSSKSRFFQPLERAK